MIDEDKIGIYNAKILKYSWSASQLTLFLAGSAISNDTSSFSEKTVHEAFEWAVACQDRFVELNELMPTALKESEKGIREARLRGLEETIIQYLKSQNRLAR